MAAEEPQKKRRGYLLVVSKPGEGKGDKSDDKEKPKGKSSDEGDEEEDTSGDLEALGKKAGIADVPAMLRFLKAAKKQDE